MHWKIWTKRADPGEDKPIPEKDLSFLGDDLLRYYEISTPDMPLAFAPKEVQQAAQAEHHLTEENNDIHFAYEQKKFKFDSRGHRSVSLDGVVRLNCREDKDRYEQSLKLGLDVKNRLRYRRQLDNCFAIQKEALEMLGFARAISEGRRSEMADTVNKLYRGSVTDDGILTKESQQKLQKAFEDEKIKASKSHYLAE